MGEWKPIDSAPKDGTAILFWDELFGHQIAHWGPYHDPLDDERVLHGWTDGVFPLVGDGRKNLPTHWTELPPPPKD